MKRINLLVMIVMGMCFARLAAQPEVRYPNPAYMHWEEPCPLVYMSNYLVPVFFPVDRFDDYPYFFNDHMCYVNPFSIREGEEGKLTIYGVSLCFQPKSFRGDVPYVLGMDRSIAFDIMLYNFTPGDSNVQLIMRQKFFLDETRSPDLFVVYTGNPYGSQDSAFKFPMYEFYFDSPVTVTGDFYAGIHSMDSFRLETGRLLHCWFGAEPQCCHSGYYGYVDMEQTVLRFWDADCPGGAWIGGGSVGVNGPGALAPQTDTVFTYYAQGIIPITMPEGYLANLSAISPEAKEGGVRLLPNPAKTRVTVEADCDIRKVEVMDMLGRVLKTRQYYGDAQSSTLDVSWLSPGSYVVRVKTAHETVAQKLVIEN